MKYPVTKRFKDKETAVTYTKGSLYRTISLVRAKELQERGFIGECLDVPSPAFPESVKKTEEAAEEAPED